MPELWSRVDGCPSPVGFVEKTLSVVCNEGMALIGPVFGPEARYENGRGIVPDRGVLPYDRVLKLSHTRRIEGFDLNSRNV
jgi:hypothetical protein